jgi:hypothetical protein
MDAGTQLTAQRSGQRTEAKLLREIAILRSQRDGVIRVAGRAHRVRTVLVRDLIAFSHDIATTRHQSLHRYLTSQIYIPEIDFNVYLQ